jgi:DNA polymerase
VSVLPAVEHPRSLAALRRAEHACERCDLHHVARAVPGVGPRSARIMLVGEQPGDREDLEGKPFVGPAGRLLDELLERAGIERDEVFLTNAVKRFRHHERARRGGGVRRIHDTPAVRQVRACGAWLESEVEIVRPVVVVLLGATAVRSMLGGSVRLTPLVGTVVDADEHHPALVAAPHPSAALRAPDHAMRERLRVQIVDALATARDLAAMGDEP